MFVGAALVGIHLMYRSTLVPRNRLAPLVLCISSTPAYSHGPACNDNEALSTLVVNTPEPWCTSREILSLQLSQTEKTAFNPSPNLIPTPTRNARPETRVWPLNVPVVVILKALSCSGYGVLRIANIELSGGSSLSSYCR